MDPDDVIGAVLQQADRVVTLADRRGKGALRALARALRDAQADLDRRLRREAQRHGGPTARFTGAQRQAYRAQLELSLRYVEARIRGLTMRAARGTAVRGWRSTATALGQLERAFGGSVNVLRIESAAMMNRGLRGLQASMLSRVQTSVDRYGDQVIRLYERTIERGLLVGATQTEMIDALVGHGGPTGIVSMAAVEVRPGVVQRLRLEAIPEGLFRRYRFWAARLVRTEVAYAQNAGAVSAMRAARDHDFPDMQKKILAMMDKRTAADSIGVHGQIRGLEEQFVDGAGRVYDHPPARPNDREVVIPWRPGWRETPRSRPVPESVRRRATTPERDGERLPVRWGVPREQMRAPDES